MAASPDKFPSARRRRPLLARPARPADVSLFDLRANAHEHPEHSEDRGVSEWHAERLISVVSDGMGSADRGADGAHAAASTALQVASLCPDLPPVLAARTALLAACDRLLVAGPDLGTTCTIAITDFRSGTIGVAAIGDSTAVVVGHDGSVASLRTPRAALNPSATVSLTDRFAPAHSCWWALPLDPVRAVLCASDGVDEGTFHGSVPQREWWTGVIDGVAANGADYVDLVVDALHRHRLDDDDITICGWFRPADTTQATMPVPAFGPPAIPAYDERKHHIEPAPWHLDPVPPPTGLSAEPTPADSRDAELEATEQPADGPIDAGPRHAGTAAAESDPGDASHTTIGGDTAVSRDSTVDSTPTTSADTTPVVHGHQGSP